MNAIQSKIKFEKGQFNLFLRFLRLLMAYRVRWAAILLLSGFGSLLGLVNPYLTKLVVDKAIGDNDLKFFSALVILGGAVFVGIGIVNGFKQYLERYVKARVKFDLNKRVFGHMEGLSFSWFQRKSTGEHLYKIGYDIDRAAGLITDVPPQAAALFPKLLLILFIVFKLNWKMAVFCVCLIPFLYLPPYYFIRKRKAVWKKLIESSQHIFKTLQENFSHIYLIKIFGKEGFETRKYLKDLIGNIRIELGSIKLEVFSGFAAAATGKIIVGLIGFYGGYQVIKGRMTLGSLTAIMVYLGQLVGMQGSFVNFFQTTVLGLVSCQRVADILDEDERIVESKISRDVVFKGGEIIFKGVSFGYIPGRPILKDLSFSIGGSGHVSLVGPSGFGKTTLLNLILRLYDPWQGEILIDGVDTRHVKLDSLRSQLGTALQEPFLFNDTVRNNIIYGKEGAGEREIIEAARISLVHEFAENFPQGYDTVIGENACRISEGQKQKIAIARALIKRPKILILDEAMSSMDSVSEKKILSNIKNGLAGTTLITVSHRLSTVMSADIVYFLKGQDRIIAGPCSKLFEEDRDFYDLFKAQIQNRDTSYFR